MCHHRRVGCPCISRAHPPTSSSSHPAAMPWTRVSLLVTTVSYVSCTVSERFGWVCVWEGHAYHGQDLSGVAENTGQAARQAGGREKGGACQKWTEDGGWGSQRGKRAESPELQNGTERNNRIDPRGKTGAGCGFVQNRPGERHGSSIVQGGESRSNAKSQEVQRKRQLTPSSQRAARRRRFTPAPPAAACPGPRCSWPR